MNSEVEGRLIELGPEPGLDAVIHVLTPYASGILPETAHSIWRLSRDAWTLDAEVVIHQTQATPVHVARNRLLKQALITALGPPPSTCRIEELAKKHFILWIDSDIEFSPWDVAKLYKALERHPDKIDLISGVYTAKERGLEIFAGRDNTDYQPGDILECRWPAMGFLLHRLQVAIQVRNSPTFGPWFQSHLLADDASDGPGGGEDSYFFGRCRAAGLRGWVHTGAIVTHIDRQTGERFRPVPPPTFVELQP